MQIINKILKILYPCNPKMKMSEENMMNGIRNRCVPLLEGRKRRLYKKLADNSALAINAKRGRLLRNERYCASLLSYIKGELVSTESMK